MSSWRLRIISAFIITSLLNFKVECDYVFENTYLQIPKDKVIADATRNASEIIKSRGFEAQEFDIVTRDGYILTIQRIINPLIAPEDRYKLKPVILQHSLVASSVQYIIDSPNVRPEIRSKRINPAHVMDDMNVNLNDMIDTQEHPNALGFYMANRGYDVFMTNVRGNPYGRRHINMTSLNTKFWAFSFDHHIKYDLPDSIDAIQKLTNKTKLGFVGFSQGNLMMFGLLADRPEYNDIIEPFVALAPVVYVEHVRSPVRLLAPTSSLVDHIDGPVFVPNRATRNMAMFMCSTRFIRDQICSNQVYLLAGFNRHELNIERSTAVLAHVPSGTSVKNLVHYFQMVKSGRFAHFDYGFFPNLRIYGQTIPPKYNLANIRSKSIALFVSTNDWMSAPEDIAHLISDLPVEPYAIFNLTEINPLWNHIDFVHSINVGKQINTRIEQVFEALDNQ